jgi:CBS domain-containing protein
MTTVAQIIERKGLTVHSTTAQTPVTTALAEMARVGVDGVVVMEGPALVGMFTSNDFLRKIVGTGLDAAALKVGDVMTRNVTVVDMAATSARCVSMMSRGRFRHLPVVDGDRVVGMVTMVDIMAFGVDGADHDVGDGGS